MLLTPEKSLCKKQQEIVVFRDKGSQRKHTAYNPNKQVLRHYKLDGGLVHNQVCCDFLLVNDSSGKAYLIELKGGHMEDAIVQLESGETLCRPELNGYEFYYRIIVSRVRTHSIQKSSFRRFKDKCGSRLKYRTGCMEETL